jgi:hypothetical protein
MKVVDAKKLLSWNCTTSASDNCCEKLARLQIFDPGPKLWYSPYCTPSVWGLDLLHWFQPAARIMESR